MHQLTQQRLRVGSDLITPVLVVHDLRIYLVADASMRSYIMRTTSACFVVLRQLRGICRSIPRTVFQSLVSCLVLPRLDYCNSILAGIPLHLVQRLQSVMNAATRLVFSSSKCDHIMPHLRQLHWRSLGFKTSSWPFLFINVFLAWHRHISPMNFIIQQSRSFEGVCVPLRLMSCLFPVLDSQPTVTELFQSLPFGSGTVFRSTSHPRRHFPVFCTRLKTYFFELGYS